MTFPSGWLVKNLPAYTGDIWDVGLIPESGKSPGGVKWQPIPVFFPVKFHGTRNLVGYSPWGHKELDMTKHPHTYIYDLSLFLLCVSHFSCVQLFVTPWTVAHQAPLSMGFSRQESWSGLPCSPPADLPNPVIKPALSPLVVALQADSFYHWATREALSCWNYVNKEDRFAEFRLILPTN